jgi:hypothetical protein
MKINWASLTTLTQYICQRMRTPTLPTPDSRAPAARFFMRPSALRLLVAAVSITALASCAPRNKAPQTEFIVAAGDSTFWVTSDAAGIRLRGSPLVLARLEGRFYELYVVDDDRSFENALFVGQRLYQRDIATGDSIEIVGDTLIPSLSEEYEERHPDARKLSPDEEPGEEPATSATSEISVLGVHGPYLSIEYHADTTGVGDDSWHMTSHSVVDLRTGKTVGLADVLGPVEAATVLARARKLYRETVDSVRRDRRPAARRAAQSLGRFRFDPTSFSLTAPNGTMMIAFSAPGQGSGGEGFVLPMRPIPVTAPPWWNEARLSLPNSTREREEHWARGPYTVKAFYDTLVRPVRLTLVDSAGQEFQIGGVIAPVHRIYWLDTPPIDRTQRTALTKAFEEAALYDDAARAARIGESPVSLALRR